MSSMPHYTAACYGCHAKTALLSHARLVERAAKAELQESVDIEALESRFQTVIEALESHQAPPPEAP